MHTVLRRSLKLVLGIINNNYRFEFTSDTFLELTCVGNNPPVS